MDKEISNNGYDYVDLELPSGTLWVTMNVGTKNPSYYSLYLQWEDTQGYTTEQVGKDKQYRNNNNMENKEITEEILEKKWF